MKPTEQKSNSVRKPADSRALRTARSLDQAFIDLVHRRSYQLIRVADITKKAGVGRSTFYAHFKSKDELLRSQVMRICTMLIHATADDTCTLDCTLFFAHLVSARRIYESILGGKDSAGSSGRHVIEKCLRKRVKQILFGKGKAVAVRADVEPDLIVRAVASGIVVIGEYGLRSGATESGEDLQRLFRLLVTAQLAGKG